MKTMRKLAYTVVALCVGAMACAEDVSLAQWRMAVATNGYVAVKGRAKVPQEVRQSIWKAYREHIGYEGVQMSTSKLVSTNEFGAVYDLPFTTADGAKHNFGVNVSSPRNQPFYWICTESSQGGKLSDAGLESYVRDRFFSGGMGESRVSSSVGTLSDGAVVSLGFAGEEVKSPFSEYYFVFIDDCPLANWGHPARCAFVKSDLTAFAVLYVNMPARATVGGADVEMRFWGEAKDGTKATTRARSVTRSVVSLAAAGAKGVFREIAGGDASNCYALLISGGGDERNNHGRYWNDICFAYNVLHLSYKLPRTNIKVLWAKGNPNSDLCWKTGKCCWKTCLGANAFPSTSLCDFDQDGNDDITGAATAKNVSAVLNEYAASLKSTDQLFIFVTDHGNKGTSRSDKEPAVLCMWGGEISDVQFANLTKNIKCPVMVALETCYSGGMVEEFLSSGQNRIIATADGFDSSQDGNHAMDVWVYNFFSALCGYYPGGTYYLHNSEVAPVDVRSVGKSCNADYDGDGKISFFEAAQFAFDNNPIRNDIPENHTSTANLHKKLFMTQYADAPTVVVKEKVLTPTLSPASGSLGHAPCTITATCGTAGATIRYTVDGSDPTATSAVYKGPSVIAADMTVSIRAFKSGMEPSDVTRVSYVFQKTAPEKALITSVSQGDSSSGIVVNWSGGAGTESYDILRSESSTMSSTTTIASGLSASTSCHADLTARPGKTYYYQIRSCNKYGTTLSAVSQGAYLMLNPPDSVTATVTSTRVGTATVKIDWNAAAGASYYRVYRESSDGTLTALGSWQTGRTYTDTVSLSETKMSYSYYVRSSISSAGMNPSPYSAEASVLIQVSSEGWKLTLDKDKTGHDDVEELWLIPGKEVKYYCRVQYEDGTVEPVANYANRLTWSLKNASGVAIAPENGEGSLVEMFSRPPSATFSIAPDAAEQFNVVLQITFTAANGTKKTREVPVIISSNGVVKRLEIDSDDFAIPGESVQLGVNGAAFGGSTVSGAAGAYGYFVEHVPDVIWTIIGGSGATITEDGELTAWPVAFKTNVTVQAVADTPLGLVVAVKTLRVSPATITKQTAIVSPIGGTSLIHIGQITGQTVCFLDDHSWLSGLTWEWKIPWSGGGTLDLSANVGHGRSRLTASGDLSFGFTADRNPGKDRECIIQLRWDGGGIDFTIIQREAPYANNPVVSGGANGTITANSTTDGSVLHYATDGEEPSEDSPVLSNSISFNDSTDFAVKAFGDWMQASDTVYASVVGKDSQWDEVEISFVPGQPGLAVPSKRTYKVNETFGTLPSFPKTNGLYFKGWTLHEGSEKLVSETASVPSLSATLYAVWSPVEEDKPDWTALPWDFKSAMTATMKVYDDTTGTYLDPSVCIIGIEDADGVCRGSSENGFGDMQSELNGKNGLYVFGVYSQIESGRETGLRIRIWNRQKGFMDVLTESLDFIVGGAAGSESEPFVVHVATGSYLKFNANGGSVDEASRRVAEGAEVGKLPLAKRDGYAFLGWYIARDGGAKVTSATKMVGYDVTLYAHWEPLAAGSCPEKAIPFPFGPSVAAYPVTLAKEWRTDEGRYDEASGVLYCKSSVARGKVYTIALPVGQEFEVACADAGAVVEYASDRSLRYCRIDARNLSAATAELVLAAYGAVGARTTVYVVEGDLVPAGAVWEDPDEGGLPGSCLGKATAFAFGPSVAAQSVRLVREWDEDGERYLEGGVHYLAATASADGRLTVAVPTAQAASCKVSCAGTTVCREDFGGLAFWIFDAEAGDEVVVRLTGARGADATVYTFGGDYLAKKLVFDPNGGSCPVPSKEVRAGSPVGELPQARRGGFIFLGWYTAREGGAKVTPETKMVNSDVTLYAHWEEVAYGSCLKKAIPFPFGPSVAAYSVNLAKEWLADEGRYDDASGVLYCKSSVARGKVYTLALPVDQGFYVDCGDEGVIVEYASYGSLRYCRIDAHDLAEETAEIVLSLYGGAGARTTVYAVEGDLVPADADYEYPPAGSCRGMATALKFGAGALAKTVRLVPEWDEDGECYLDGGVYYLRSTASADGPLTVAVPAAQADGCEVACGGYAASRADFGSLALWIFDAEAGDEVLVRLAGARGADATVYTFGGDYLAKELVFDPNGGTCPEASREVRAGVPVGELPVPDDRAGHAFLGWFTAREGGARVTAATVMVGYDVTLYAHWEKLAAGSSQEAAIPFAMTTSVAAYPVSLAREWLEDELKYSDEWGTLYCKTMLKRGKVYTMAVPKGLDEVDAWCVNGEASVTFGSDASLQYVRFDTTNMAAEETEAYFAVFGDAGQRTTVYAVEADMMPDCSSCIDAP